MNEEARLYRHEPGISLVNVNGHLYRVHAVAGQENTRNEHSEQRAAEAEDDSAYAVAEKSKGVFTLEMGVPSELFGRLIGRQGATLKKIQSMSGAHISVPKNNSSGPVVVLSKTSRASVVKAAREIEAIVGAAKNLAPFTHFLSLPLTDERILERVQVLTRQVCEEIANDDKKGFDKSMATKPAHFHVTLFMLKLLSASEVARAANVLEDASAALYDAVGTRTLLLNVKGIDAMERDSSEAHSVYAKVGENEQLQKCIAELARRFKDAGFLAESVSEDVKIHATLFNTRFRNNSGEKNEERTSFDARTILQGFGSFDFGSVRVPAVHLSQRGAYDANGYYHCVASAKLP